MIVAECNGCCKRGPDEVIAMNKTGFLAGGNDKFTKLLTFFFF